MEIWGGCGVLGSYKLTRGIKLVAGRFTKRVYEGGFDPQLLTERAYKRLRY